MSQNHLKSGVSQIQSWHFSPNPHFFQFPTWSCPLFPSLLSSYSILKPCGLTSQYRCWIITLSTFPPPASLWLKLPSPVFGLLIESWLVSCVLFLSFNSFSLLHPCRSSVILVLITLYRIAPSLPHRQRPKSSIWFTGLYHWEAIEAPIWYSSLLFT